MQTLKKIETYYLFINFHTLIIVLPYCHLDINLWEGVYIIGSIWQFTQHNLSSEFVPRCMKIVHAF